MDKKNILIAILSIVLTFSFYFNYQKFNSENFGSKNVSILTFERKMECQTAGDKIYQRQISDGNEFRYINPEYKYNEKLDTCLYFGGYIGDPGLGNLQKWVIDSLTNEELVSYIEVDGEPFTAYCDSCKETVQDFDIEKERLFKE